MASKEGWQDLLQLRLQGSMFQKCTVGISVALLTSLTKDEILLARSICDFLSNGQEQSRIPCQGTYQGVGRTLGAAEREFCTVSFISLVLLWNSGARAKQCRDLAGEGWNEDNCL